MPDSDDLGRSEASTYRPWDRDEKLGPVPEGGFKPDDPKVTAWEAAHGHDLRLKCYPEFGCRLREDEIEAAAREVVEHYAMNEISEQAAAAGAIDRLRETLDA